MSMSFKGRFQFLTQHPEFKRRPVLVTYRLLVWLVYRYFGFAPTIRIHHRSAMRIHPEKQGMGAPGLFYIFREGFEEMMPRCIKEFVSEGDDCFDIGTNIGIWTLLMAERCGKNAAVYSFEPMSRNLQHLRDNIQLSGSKNITVIPTALGRTTGKVQLYTPADPGRTSLAPEGADDLVEEVTLRKLDEVWEELGKPEIRFVKMDVEGSEPFVLEGGSAFFRQCRPVVVSEINAFKLANMKTEAKAIFEFFEALDYEAYQLEDASAHLQKITHSEGGDVVFIPRNAEKGGSN